MAYGMWYQDASHAYDSHRYREIWDCVTTSCSDPTAKLGANDLSIAGGSALYEIHWGSNGTIWLVVSTPLENMLVRLDHHPNYILAKILHNVPNHQPLSSIMDIINIIAIILTIYIISPLVDQMQQALESEKKTTDFWFEVISAKPGDLNALHIFQLILQSTTVATIHLVTPRSPPERHTNKGKKHFFVAHFHGLSFSQNVVLDKW